jgi:hypothetical protein
MAVWINTGKFGGSLQVVVDESRLMTSQVSMLGE